VLNKLGGPFTADDESLLRAFTAQISISLENAKLFLDVQHIKNYNEAMLESMSNGVITLDERQRIVTCNAAGLRILRVPAANFVNKLASEFFVGCNAWVLDTLKAANESQAPELSFDAELQAAGEMLSVNATALPLLSTDQQTIGSMLLIEDISSEKRLKSMMSRYMDPGIADRLLAGGSEALGGQSAVATILFSDIWGFTTIAEKLGAHDTVSLLNEYFTLMVDCIQREEGMLDKFIGDAIMAVFGIPVGHDDDADRALRTAIAMIRELSRWNRTRVAEGKSPVEIGIGLNTDTVVTGNIGSKKRMDYTVIGDGVNLAARLESASRVYGARILISEFTYAQLKSTYYTREVDLVVVKGKTKPVSVYEVMDFHTEETYPRLTDALRQFRIGLAEYRKGHWQNAITFFDEVLSMNPYDKAAKMYVERCQKLERTQPPGAWDGVFVMKEK
jgi:adenylate cyclase